MSKQSAITQSFNSLSEVESRFNLRRTSDERFFTEWWENLPELSDIERESLDLIQRRYLYHRSDGELTEGTVTLLMGSPLLEKAGFYDYPFKMRGEASVEIRLDGEENEGEILRGRIDVLVLQNRLWITLLESKRTAISAMTALPQVLSYMMASPNTDKPLFAIITNGDNIIFVKLLKSDLSQYDISDIFSPFPLRNQLYDVLKILKNIGCIIRQN